MYNGVAAEGTRAPFRENNEGRSLKCAEVLLLFVPVCSERTNASDTLDLGNIHTTLPMQFMLIEQLSGREREGIIFVFT